MASLDEIAALHHSGNTELARARCLTFIASSPGNAEAHYLLALIEYRSGALAAAAEAARRAAALAPTQPANWNALGAILASAGRAPDAVEAFERAHALAPNVVSTMANLGNALLDAGRLDDALAILNKAIQLGPNDYRLAIARGSALRAKSALEASLSEFQRASALQPHPLEALLGQADVLRLLKREAEAIRLLETVLAADPSNVFALQASASLLHKQGELDAAHDRFMRLWTLSRTRPQAEETANYALSMAVASARAICDWTDSEALEGELLRRIRSGVAGASPIVSFALFDDTEVQALCARRYFAHSLPVEPAPLPIVVRDHKRLRLGYLSADFREHPTARLIAGLIEDHDRDLFEVCAFSNGPDDGSALRTRLVNAFDSFTDITRMGDEEAAALTAQQEIDILVDLSGPLIGGRPGVIARKPAPVVAHFIGNPGPPGLSAIDYFIADQISVPLTERDKFGCAVVRLPCSVMPTDPRATGGWGEEIDRPASDKFVFFALCQSFKLSREVFGTWMRILRRTPHGVLWLLEDNRFLRRRLEAEAKRCGIDPARLVFFPRVEHREHMARHRMADLVLDTWPCGAHTTAVEALFCGVPIITKAGLAFASRVGASVLSAADMPELIAEDLTAYEELAVQIATSPPRHAELKAKLATSLRESALFDSRLHRRSLEAAYQEIWRRVRSGQGIESFDIA